jgi:hypothetical protein
MNAIYICNKEHLHHMWCEVLNQLQRNWKFKSKAQCLGSQYFTLLLMVVLCANSYNMCNAMHAILLWRNFLGTTEVSLCYVRKLTLNVLGQNHFWRELVWNVSIHFSSHKNLLDCLTWFCGSYYLFYISQNWSK